MGPPWVWVGDPGLLLEAEYQLRESLVQSGTAESIEPSRRLELPRLEARLRWGLTFPAILTLLGTLAVSSWVSPTLPSIGLCS